MTIVLDDDRGRMLTFASAPKRVVSLVPSDTYSVAALGCADALVGRTDYCELPVHVARAVPSVGGTKNPRVADIVDLRPDLVIANQEENTKGDLSKLIELGIRVCIAFPKTAAAALSHLAKLARVFGVAKDAAVVSLCKTGYEELRASEAFAAATPPVRVFCPIWADPLMTIHQDTFISDMLRVSGADNVFSDRQRRYPLARDLGANVPERHSSNGERDTRYPRVTREEVLARAPELIVLPDEPHPFSEAEADDFRALSRTEGQHARVVPISGKDICWYGAYTVEALPRVRALVARERR